MSQVVFYLPVAESLNSTFSFGRIKHFPIGIAFGVLSFLIIYFDDVARFTVRNMNLEHLFLDMIDVGITDLRRIFTIV